MLRSFHLIIFFLCSIIVLYPQYGSAKTLAVDLAEDHVDITAGFTGSDIVMFGKTSGRGDVVMLVKGPERTATVWRKGRFLGIWMNKDSMKFRNVPAYYDYAVSRPEEKIAAASVLKDNGIGLNALYFKPDNDKADTADVYKYQEALIRNKQVRSLFPLTAKKIEFLTDDFFKARFHMPADVPTGTYHVQTFLIQNGKIIDRSTTSLRVAQVGLGAQIYEFAYSHAFAYGGVCVLFAVFAGWLANVLYRRD